MIKRCTLLLTTLTLVLLTPVTPAHGRRAMTGHVVVHRVTFPADTAAHPSAPVEWWYFVGHLAGANRHTYGFETTFFKFSGLRKYFPGSPADTVYRTDVAITDEAARRFHDGVSYQALEPPHTIAGTRALRLRAGTITVETLGTLRYHLHGSMDDGSVDLTVTARRIPMLVNGGFTGWGAGYTYYYSLTRMQTEGTLTIGKQHIVVHGVAWHDHQWGDMGGSSVRGWDWMALQVTDGIDLSLVNERPAIKPWARWAQALLPDNSQPYVQGQVFITPLRYWRSPHTGALYPASWHVRIPRLGLDVVVRPTVSDQEVIDDYPVGGYRTSYWEGSCTVTGTRAGHPVRGKAYTELTGYGTPPPTPRL